MHKVTLSGLKRATLWCLAGILTLTLAFMVAFIGANVWVLQSTKGRIYDNAAMCPSTNIGIVFGTSFRLRNGATNPYYNARMDTAAELYRLGRVSNLLLSGDNRTMYYNEPITMWRDLQVRHVPKEMLVLDYAGLSTLDTLYRAHHIFGVTHAALITQRWHLPRALFIARAEGIDAYGCAANPPITGRDHAMDMREWFARALAVFDLYIRHKKARIMGEPEPLPAHSEIMQYP